MVWTEKGLRNTGISPAETKHRYVERVGLYCFPAPTKWNIIEEKRLSTGEKKCSQNV